MPTGNRHLQALRFEPDDSKFDVEEIRRNIPGIFTEDLVVTVVAHDSEDDLGLTRDREVYVDVLPEVMVISSLERLARGLPLNYDRD